MTRNGLTWRNAWPVFGGQLPLGTVIRRCLPSPRAREGHAGGTASRILRRLGSWAPVGEPFRLLRLLRLLRLPEVG